MVRGIYQGMKQFLLLSLGFAGMSIFSNCAHMQSPTQAEKAAPPVAQRATAGVDGGDALKALDVTYKALSVASMVRYLGL